MVLKKIFRKGLWTLAILFVAVNAITAIHAYKFTHFSNGGIRTERINLSFLNKIKLLFTGVDNPRPVNTVKPSRAYTTGIINSNVKIECWHIPAQSPTKGTVILFHGYTSNKSELIERSEVFLKNGFNCLLVDFMGSGGSEGDQTTIGFMEAQEVRDCYNFIDQSGEQHIYLFGSSMGAVAVMKAINDYKLQPQGIIIECPFGTMYETVCARFRMLNIPSFPLASLLVFWGGTENGFNGFSFNPVAYARNINCPVLLQYGEKDERVTRSEIDAVFRNLHGPKTLITYPQAGHDDYLKKSRAEWEQNVTKFILIH